MCKTIPAPRPGVSFFAHSSNDGNSEDEVNELDRDGTHGISHEVLRFENRFTIHTALDTPRPTQTWIGSRMRPWAHCWVSVPYVEVCHD
jgi:hypothetical protein